METIWNNSLFQPSDQGLKHQAMIAAALVLSLLAILVATDPEPVGSSVHPSPEPPLRPDRKSAGKKIPEADRVAA